MSQSKAREKLEQNLLICVNQENASIHGVTNALNRELIKTTKALLEAMTALEFYSKQENIRMTVWEDDTRDGRCWLENVDEIGLKEVYGRNSSGDYGIEANEALARIESLVVGGGD